MANRIPEPRQTAAGPTYEGGPLARPDDEVVDQGAGFDVRTLISRRALLSLIGPRRRRDGARRVRKQRSSPSRASASAASTSRGTDLPAGEIPDETAGPYPGDGSNGPDVLESSGIVRSDIRSSIGAGDPVDGAPLSFTLTVTDMANDDVAFENVAVYAWHCDAEGRYSMYSEGVEDESWLRGVQVADANGQVTFTSIVPGCYAGRWPHIHFEVYPDLDSISDSAKAIATSQMAFPEDMLGDTYRLPAYDGSAENLARVSLASDNVFGEDGAALQLATVSGDATDGYTASLAVRVDTTTEPAAGGIPPGGGRRP
jgi:protocatechuate 3,4-dioxygenase beta subunit